jgi:hypothetical protein
LFFVFAFAFETDPFYAAEASFKVVILLPQPPNYWDCRWASLHAQQKSVFVSKEMIRHLQNGGRIFIVKDCSAWGATSDTETGGSSHWPLLGLRPVKRCVQGVMGTRRTLFWNFTAEKGLTLSPQNLHLTELSPLSQGQEQRVGSLTPVRDPAAGWPAICSAHGPADILGTVHLASGIFWGKKGEMLRKVHIAANVNCKQNSIQLSALFLFIPGAGTKPKKQKRRRRGHSTLLRVSWRVPGGAATCRCP